MQCVRSFITRKLLNNEIGRSSGLLHPRCLPIPIRNSGFGDSRTLSELTAAVSAQDFHLIPFSLIPSRLEETSTKIGCKYTDIYSFAKQFCIFFVCQDDFPILSSPHNSPAQENRKAHGDGPDASICLPLPVPSDDGEPWHCLTHKGVAYPSS